MSGEHESGQELMKRYRNERGMSQDELAFAIRAAELEDGLPGKAGVSYVSQVERGVNTPSRHRALLIDDILGAGGEVARAFGYRPAGGQVSTVSDADLGDVAALVAELRAALDEARTRDAAMATLTEIATAAADQLSEALDLLRKIDEFVDWRGAALQRGEDAP